MSQGDISRRTLLAASGALLTAIAAGSARTAVAASAGTAADAAGDLLIGGDLRVSRLGFGAMRVTGDGIWGAPGDPVEARRVLRRAVELGVDFIDTADAYGPGTSEELIAEALHPYPAGLVIATKGGITRPSREQWAPDGRPEHLRAACEASLKRLRVERIDLYQLHTIDPRVPLEDSIGELVRLQRDGKIRHIGVSNFDAEQLAKARRIVKVVSVQNRYNVADRASDAVLQVCQRDGIAFIPWRPLGEGSDAAADGPAARLAKIAERRALSMPQAAIAWALARSPVMLPIPGTSKVVHLEENVAAAAVKLTAEEMKEVG
jgi:pyridoxine 4-dehydrogenase